MQWCCRVAGSDTWETSALHIFSITHKKNTHTHTYQPCARAETQRCWTPRLHLMNLLLVRAAKLKPSDNSWSHDRGCSGGNEVPYTFFIIRHELFFFGQLEAMTTPILSLFLAKPLSYPLNGCTMEDRAALRCTLSTNCTSDGVTGTSWHTKRGPPCTRKLRRSQQARTSYPHTMQNDGDEMKVLATSLTAFVFAGSRGSHASA